MASNRIEDFKNEGKDEDEMRRRGNEKMVESRQEHLDYLFKKRKIQSGETTDEEDFETFETLQQIVISASSGDPETQLQAVQRVRKLLSSERNPSDYVIRIDVVIRSGILPVLVNCLQIVDNTNLQFEAAWTLTNIASGTSAQAEALVESGAVPVLIELLKSPHLNVCELAVWALGNIIADRPIPCSDLYSHHFKDLLLSLFFKEIPISFKRIVAWVLISLCNDSHELVVCWNTELLPALHLLIKSNDINVLVDSTWALSRVTDNISDSDINHIQIVIESGILKSLVPLLAQRKYIYRHREVQRNVLRVFAKIVTGTEEQKQEVLDANVLMYFRKLLQHPDKKIINEALSFLRFVTGNAHQFQTVIDARLLPSIVLQLNKGDYQTQFEAAWTVHHWTLIGHKQQMAALIHAGVVIPLCRMSSVFKQSDDWGDRSPLKCLNNLLKSTALGPERDFVCTQIVECGGLCEIEYLRAWGDELADKIIKDYFSDDDETVLMSLASLFTDHQYHFDAASDPNNAGFNF